MSTGQPGRRHGLSRRELLGAAALSGLVAISVPGCRCAHAADGDRDIRAGRDEAVFKTRGVVVRPSDVRKWPWPEKAKAAGLSTIGTHLFPHEVAAFVKTNEGQAFLDACRNLGIEVEHELHAMNDLLPRDLFEKAPSMFRMNEEGARSADCNLCVHSKEAVEVVCRNAVRYAEILRPTTGRYFYWIDDGRPMCRCPKCKGLSDSDQALLLENEMLKALRKTNPGATLAHLAYARTMTAPTLVKPEPGVFLEFAPIARRFDQPLSNRNAPGHAQYLDDLDANLAVLGSEGAQALEYWLDESLFYRANQRKLTKIPWRGDVFLDDLATYGSRGIRHVTTFAVMVNADYVEKFGEPPVNEYGQGLCEYQSPL